jgi:hypothetical protein
VAAVGVRRRGSTEHAERRVQCQLGTAEDVCHVSGLGPGFILVLSHALA